MTFPEAGSDSLSPQQVDILQEFREQVFAEGILHEGDSLGTDDPTLLRFLRARKFNLNEAKKMLKNCQEWRQTVSGTGLDDLYNRMDPFDYPGREHVFRSWSMYFHRTDKKGRPINIQFFGGMNLPELYKHITREKHMEAIIVNAESLTREVLPSASRAAGHRIEESLVIVDLKGFGLSQFWQAKSLIQASFQLSQDYFPETMGQLAVVNAPSSFTFIWSIVKPWLAKETAEKVDILGKDYKEVLLQIVDADNLPSVLGGNCTCSGSGGCDLSSAGPWMEERLAKKALATEEKTDPADDETNISRKAPSEGSSNASTQVEGSGEATNEKVTLGDLIAETTPSTQQVM